MTLKISTYKLTKTPISVHKGTDMAERTKTAQQTKTVQQPIECECMCQLDLVMTLGL